MNKFLLMAFGLLLASSFFASNEAKAETIQIGRGYYCPPPRYYVPVPTRTDWFESTGSYRSGSTSAWGPTYESGRAWRTYGYKRTNGSYGGGFEERGYNHFSPGSYIQPFRIPRAPW